MTENQLLFKSDDDRFDDRLFTALKRYGFLKFKFYMDNIGSEFNIKISRKNNSSSFRCKAKLLFATKINGKSLRKDFLDYNNEDDLNNKILLILERIRE